VEEKEDAVESVTMINGAIEGPDWRPKRRGE
jgi:hypothetical protein